MQLSDFNRDFIIKRYTGIEAGYVNDPSDLGGETNHGITKALADSYKGELVKRFGWDGSMRNLSIEAANWLYVTEFWNKLLGDDILKIHPLIMDKLFDIAINAGKTRAAKFLQEYLNVNNDSQKLYSDLVVDGALGAKTLTALSAYIKKRGDGGLKLMLHTLVARQTSYYIDISVAREANERFSFGWLDRAYQSAKLYEDLGYLYH